MIVEGILSDLSQDRVAYWTKRCRDAGANATNNYKGAVVKPNGYFLQQMPEELAHWLALLEEAKTDGFRYLGIGIASGGDTRLISEVLGERAQLFGIDMPQHGMERIMRLATWLSQLASGQRQGECAPLIHFGNSHSHEAAEWLEAAMGLLKLNAAFVDGDHSEDGTYADLCMVEPYCGAQTYIGVHDIVAPHVKGAAKRVVERVIADGRYKQVGYVEKDDEPVPMGMAVLQRRPQ